MTAGQLSQDHLVGITLDEASIGPGTPEQEHERRIAIFDLLENNSFVVVGHERGPYRMSIGLHGTQLALNVRTHDGEPVVLHVLGLQPFRRLLRDYRLICDNHVAAMRTATPTQIEAIDMGRRGLHNEGAARLMERLEGKIHADFETLRRLFTLLTALHWR